MVLTSCNPLTYMVGLCRKTMMVCLAGHSACASPYEQKKKKPQPVKKNQIEEEKNENENGS